MSITMPETFDEALAVVKGIVRRVPNIDDQIDSMVLELAGKPSAVSDEDLRTYCRDLVAGMIATGAVSSTKAHGLAFGFMKLVEERRAALTIFGRA